MHHHMFSWADGNYLVSFSLPEKQQFRADMGLGIVLALSPLWAITVGDINQYMGLIGGFVGISIGITRLYRLWFKKEKDKES